MYSFVNNDSSVFHGLCWALHFCLGACGTWLHLHWRLRTSNSVAQSTESAYIRIRRARCCFVTGRLRQLGYQFRRKQITMAIRPWKTSIIKIFIGPLKNAAAVFWLGLYISFFTNSGRKQSTPLCYDAVFSSQLKWVLFGVFYELSECNKI